MIRASGWEQSSDVSVISVTAEKVGQNIENVAHSEERACNRVDENQQEKKRRTSQK